MEVHNSNRQSSDTHINVVEFSHTWKIHNYSYHGKKKGEFLKSSNFSDRPNSTNSWLLRLYPNGFGKDDSHISLYLIPHVGSRLPVVACCKLYFLDCRNQETNVMRLKAPRKFSTFDYGKGFTKFMKSLQLRHQTCILLPDNVLTVGCRVTMVTDKPHRVQVPELELSKHLNHLLSSENLTDVVFVVEGEEVKAHKAILAARSPVFEAMFSREFTENVENRVDIVDMTAVTLKKMLKFLYTGDVDRLSDNADRLLIAANKYCLDRLKAMCSSYLATTFTTENIPDLLLLADRHNASELKEQALNFIHVNKENVFASPSWHTLIVTRPSLSVEVFQHEEPAVSTSPLTTQDDN